MYPFRSNNSTHRLYIRKNELALLREHGLLHNRRYVTIALGIGGQMREARQMLVPDKGYMKQIDVVECTSCLNSNLNKILRIGPYRDWYVGHTAKEKHWHSDRKDPRNTLGLKLRCFYSVYMDLLKQAKLAYQTRGGIVDSKLAKEGRIALVSVWVRDILSVTTESISSAGMKPEPYEGDAIVLKVSKLKVMDLVDQLPLIPSKSFLDTVLSAPLEWHLKWHQMVDAIQTESWRDFPAKIMATLEVAGQ